MRAASTVARRRPDPPRAVTVVLNPAAGGAAHGSELGDLFEKSGIAAAIVETKAGDDPADLARNASGPASIIVAAGGDGTVSRVAAGLVGTDAVLGIIPLGTLNHFAKDLGVPLDPPTAIAAIAEGHIRHVDVAAVNNRVFVNNSSIGIYPNIVEARDELRGRGFPKWVALALASARVLRSHRGVHVRMTDGERLSTWRTPFVFVGNNEYVVDGIHLGSRPRLDGGQLFTYLAPRTKTRALPLLLAKALIGRAMPSGAFQIVSGSEFWIETLWARRIRVSLDGETTVMRTPLHYRSLPGQLRVIVPAP